MKPKTIIRHLTALVKRLEDSDFSTQSEDKAVREVIWLLKAAERDTQALQALRGRFIDHIDGNPRNNDPGNLRVVTAKENV